MYIIYENDYGERIQVSLPKTWHLTQHFTLGEMANNKAKELVKYVSTPRTRKFMELFEEFRVWYAVGITPTSGFRTKSFNASIGGDVRSLHLDGLACDFRAAHTDAQREKCRKKWRSICEAHGEIGGINYYTHGYHMCIGEEKFGNKGFVTRDYRGKRGDW